MTASKKGAIILLWILNIINILAGAVSQFKILFKKDIDSIIPINAPLSVNQILMVNFLVLIIICVLISVILTYLVTDIAYSPIEILQNFSPLFLIPSAVVSLVGIFNAVSAEIFSDKIWLIAGVIVYLTVSIIEISCLITVKEDAED